MREGNEENPACCSGAGGSGETPTVASTGILLIGFLFNLVV
jgi:hypothetical protein